MKYLAKLVYCYAEEDNYKVGTEGQTFDKTYDMEFEAKSLGAVKQKIMDFYNVDSLYIDDGLFKFSTTEDAEGIEPSERQIERWKEGKEKLWYVDTAYRIYKCEDVTE